MESEKGAPAAGGSMGRAVLVTGCSSGIGRAIALHLARRGMLVFASVRRGEQADELRDSAGPALASGSAPGLVPIYPLDLTRLDHIPPVRAQIETELKRRGLPGLFAVVNNAGGGGIAPIELMDLAAFQGELAARLLGPVALLQALLPSIRRAAGRVVWIATPALLPVPYVASIHACDFAANCLARTLNLELAPWGIPSVMVRCGGIRTPSAARTEAEAKVAMEQWPPEARALYGPIMAKQLRGFAEFDERRSPPETVAEVVLRALDARRPRLRYQVGHLSRAGHFAELLPQGLIDRIMAGRG